MRPLFTLLTLLAACAEGDSSTLPADRVPVVIDDTDDWDMLLNWEAIPGFEIESLYARATVRSVSGGTCAGGLIDDDVFVTAEHCHLGTATSTLAVFGYYGPGGDGDTSGGEADARLRLAQLGVPAPITQDSTLVDWDDLRIFDCTKDYEVPGNDVAFWVCDPNTISYDLDGTTIDFDVYPGHLWGHFNVVEDTPPVGTRLMQTSASRLCVNGIEQNSRNLAMGFGDLVLQSNACATPTGTSYSDCFRLSNDHTGGSSGGPILDRDSFTLFGVVNGQNVPPTGDWDDACNDVDLTGSGGLGPFGHNIGAYVYDADVDDYTGRAPTGEPTGANGSVTTVMGTAAGAFQFSGQCPDDTLAAGIVGTTAPSGKVGSFGLVCLHDDGPSNIQMDRATVLAYGSADVGMLSGAPFDFNTFEHEILSSNGWEPHVLAMCPPGFFLRALEGRAAARVGRIKALGCEHPDTGQQVFAPVNDTTTGIIGNNSAGTLQSIFCPAGEFIAGMEVWIPGPTGGIQGYCRNAD